MGTHNFAGVLENVASAWRMALGSSAAAAEAEARTAKALGFDAVLLSLGGLAHRTEEELVERTHAVADNMPVIGFYLQTACGGRAGPSYEYWKAAADTPGVVAINARPSVATGTRASTWCGPWRRQRARREEIALYTGNDDNIVADLLTPYRFPVDGKEVELRFVGGLLGHWSVWTHSVVKLYEELREYRDGRDIPAELLARGAAVTALQRRVLRRGAQLCRMHPGGPRGAAASGPDGGHVVPGPGRDPQRGTGAGDKPRV